MKCSAEGCNKKAEVMARIYRRTDVGLCCEHMKPTDFTEENTGIRINGYMFCDAQNAWGNIHPACTVIIRQEWNL